MTIMTQRTTTEQKFPALNPTDRLKLLRGAVNPTFFNKVTRPNLYHICGGDAERVHELVLHTMREQGVVSRYMAHALSPVFFSPPENLSIRIKGIEQKIVPFGTAAGMDKNGEALFAFGNIFGFQEPGTIIVPSREGNNRIRVASHGLNAFNCQGFPSKGLSYFYSNITKYRQSGGKAIIFANICGLPVSETNAIKVAMSEMETLMGSLNSHVDGYVWNPFSPNTKALEGLRTPEIFYDTACLMEKLAPGKPRLLKLGPYEEKDRSTAMLLVSGFIRGGGHGVVTTNTKKVDRQALPEGLKESWGYESAGISGELLKPYRIRSIFDIRLAFPNSIIVATGGIYTSEDAYLSFCAGANMLEGYTPYTVFGPGLVIHLMRGVSERLEKAGWYGLSDLQDHVSDAAKFGGLEEFFMRQQANLHPRSASVGRIN